MSIGVGVARAVNTASQTSSVTQHVGKNDSQKISEAQSSLTTSSVSGYQNTIVVGIDGYEVQGFLTDEGLSIGLQNNWGKLFGDGNLFSALSKAFAQIGAFTGGGSIPDTFKKGYEIVKGVGGKTSGSLGNSAGALTANVVTNSPMFWTGTEPLDLNITFYQIAERPGQIMEAYQALLIAAAPTLDNPQGIITTATKTADSFISVYGLYFTDLVVTNLTCKVKGPFDNVMSPAIGEYNLVAKTQKMVDKDRLKEIFLTSKRNVQEEAEIALQAVQNLAGLGFA